MITRQIKCPQCGAPKETLEESIMMMCDYCGSLISVETSQYFRGDGMAALHEQAIRKLVNPTAADARKTRLTFEMQKAQEAGDIESWRLMAQEYYPLFAVTEPDLVPGGGQDPGALRDWVLESAKSAELMHFDPQVKEAYERYTTVMGELSGSEDPVAKAGEMMQAAVGYYQVMFGHPEYPKARTPTDVQQMAKQMVRGTVNAYESLLAKGDAARIYAEVLGDKTASEDGAFGCENCGARLVPSDLEGKRCPYCGGLIHVDEEDPWLASLLATFRPMVKMLGNDEALAQAAVNHPLTGYWSGGKLPDAGDAFKFLQEAVGWLDAETILKSVKQLKKAYSEKEDLKQFFRYLKAAMGGWVQRPKPEHPAAAVAAAFGTEPAKEEVAGAGPEDLSQDPWVEQQLAMWEYSKPGPDAAKEELAMSLVSMVISPFQMGGAVTLGQARAFLKRAAPQASTKKLVEALKLMKQAVPNEQTRKFLKDLSKKLVEQSLK